MSKMYFSAVFHPEKKGYSVSVPDLDGCFTQGETLCEAVEMAQDAIGLFLDDESKELSLSLPEEIVPKQGDFVMLITYDRQEYNKRHNNKAIKKTLTIPCWLNEIAEEQHINFSSVLQRALKQQLHID